jgi:hypothetical protein
MEIDWSQEVDHIELADTVLLGTLLRRHMCNDACSRPCLRMLSLYYVAYASINAVKKTFEALRSPAFGNYWMTLVCRVVIQGAWVGHWLNERPMVTFEDPRAMTIVRYCDFAVRDQFRLHHHFPGWRNNLDTSE